MTNKYTDNFKLRWVECKSQINFNSFKEGRLNVWCQRLCVPCTVPKSHYPPCNHHAGAQAIIKVKGRHYRWLEGGYDLEIGQF